MFPYIHVLPTSPFFGLGGDEKVQTFWVTFLLLRIVFLRSLIIIIRSHFWWSARSILVIRRLIFAACIPFWTCQEHVDYPQHVSVQSGKGEGRRKVLAGDTGGCTHEEATRKGFLAHNVLYGVHAACFQEVLAKSCKLTLINFFEDKFCVVESIQEGILGDLQKLIQPSGMQFWRAVK